MYYNSYKVAATVISFFLFSASIVLVVYGLYNLKLEMDLDAVGIKTEGIVIDLAVVQPYRLAIVEFRTKDGQTIQFQDKLYWNWQFEKYKVGDKVEVIYDPKAPYQTAVINDFFQRNTAPWFPVIIGVVVAFVVWITRKILHRKSERWQQKYGHLLKKP